MEYLLWAVICGLSILVIVLFVRLELMKKSADQILESFGERIQMDTNTLIDISSRDRHMRKLASDLNQQLRILRKERLKYQQGNTELSDAVTNISHDLRTPLTAIYGYLSLLWEEEKSDDANRYLQLIEGRADALKQLIDELFDYTVLSSSGEETKELIDITSVLEESIAAFYGVMKERNIEPVIHLTEHKVERTLNRSALARIFENILSNAIKYSDGDLVIEMNNKGQITFSNMAKELSIVSVGRLFDRFFTVQTGRNSTGIGLSIAKLLTEQEGGTITATYEEQRLSIILEWTE